MSQCTNDLCRQVLYQDIAEIGGDSDGTVQTDIKRRHRAIAQNGDVAFQAHGFIACVDVAEDQRSNLNRIAHLPIQSALHNGDVFDLDGLRQDSNARDPTRLGQLSLPLLFLGLPDHLSAFLPFPVTHNGCRRGRGWQRCGIGNVRRDARDDDGADIDIATQ